MSIPWAQQFDWTEERVATLRSLFDQKHSTAHIARELGGDLTKNAVIGKLHRLGLRREARVRKVRPHHVERKAPFKVRSRVPLPPKERAPVQQFTCTPVPLLDLPYTGACKFEVTNSDKPADYLFCGNPTESDALVYCRDHMRVVYR